MINKIHQVNLAPKIIIILLIIIIIGTISYLIVKKPMEQYEEIYSVQGTVTDVSSNSLTIETTISKKIPTKELINLINITINIDINTILVSKDDSFDIETQTNIDFSNIIVGDYVLIDSNENIGNVDRFTATKITKLVETEEPPHE